MRPLRITLALLIVAAGCSSRGGRAGGESSAAACSDGRDNDGDGLVDCAEPSCTVHAFCSGGSDGGTDAGVDSARPDTGPPPDTGTPFDGGPSCGEPIDVVFVIDVSTSMMDEVASIRTGIDSIASAALALTSDVKFSLVVFVDDVVAVGGCAPFADAATLQSELAMWQSFTSSNNQPGGSPYPNGDCPENSIDALYTAATVCPWRAATRILIHVTDDTFAERPATLSSAFGIGGIPVMHTYAEAVSALMTNEVRVGVFAAPGAGEFCGAGTSPDVGQGFHASYMGMPSIADATGGRAWSIRDVRAGTLDMATAIAELIEDEHCTLY